MDEYKSLRALTHNSGVDYSAAVSAIETGLIPGRSVNSLYYADPAAFRRWVRENRSTND
ncbi:Uncharacterised protein (plasmid) [Tsukamurella tyrosinosolvens]|uniref:DNA-binding protein n=1 Tax=Tsukamurella tyrosinosolvens TaxID=57704 RepID=A0A1H4QPQ0_TSUTY|nr:hypothetical protein [Tsukamurella tyrosinosolvens]SEC21511.1 hypothetical protein SAMN04489793_1810 [Tsukamurella tyrosinosolvens]VEH92533.1 Uncharacterised protein [Tsukamurella tyrosinosolvens]